MIPIVNLHVVLLEKETAVGFGTSKANCGIIHGGHHAARRTFKDKLEWAGNQVWNKPSNEFSFGFQLIGELTAAVDVNPVILFSDSDLYPQRLW